MQESKNNFLPKFSHIYVEDQAFNYPDTKLILDKFKNSEIIKINNYKEVFNRSGQNWRLQKKSQKLILAVKKDGFLYELSLIHI